MLIMRNHGLLTVGRTAGEAFMWMYWAERACYMQLSFQQAGAELNPIPEEVQRTNVERNRFNNRSEEHTSELQSLMRISYAVFCLKKNTLHYFSFSTQY